MTEKNHTFAICAYNQSPYLEACIISLKRQTVKSNIIMVTSTPNDYIDQLAKKYDIPCFVNSGESGITQDWNFGYACAGTKYITLAHQDDIYEKDYLKTALDKLEKVKKPLIFFSNYYEIRDGRKVANNQLLMIKRLMLLPLLSKKVWSSRRIRRWILAFGSPICCPSVLYASENLPDVIFQNGFCACEDWEAWERISRLQGSFIYSSKMLMGHRIHADSETSAVIERHGRSDEEFQMYCKFWPKWFAGKLVKLYAKGQKSNELD